MDKDKAQMNHSNLSRHEKNLEENNSHVSGVSECESLDKEADMDELEAKLFAMVKSRL